MSKNIYLSNHDIVGTVNFAGYTVHNHYHRMWQTIEAGLEKIIIGKLGEVAIIKYLEFHGIKSKGNFRIDTGIDTNDLKVKGQNIEIKTKRFKSPQLPPFENIYLHIPIDQYAVMVQHQTDFVIAVCIPNDASQLISDWLNIKALKIIIVGGLPFETYNKLKVFHQGGIPLSDGFVPIIDSYGVPWSQLHDIDMLIKKIRNPDKADNQLKMGFTNSPT